MRLLFLMLCVNFLLAKNVFILTDRVLSLSDYKIVKQTIFYDYKKIFVQKGKNNISFWKIPKGEVYGYYRNKRHIPKNASIFKIINSLMESNDLNKGDIIIIFSNMYFKINIPNKVSIDSSKQILNDGFITSQYSPFRILLDKNINKLKDTKVMIVTKNNNSIFYLQKMRRFFYHFFKQFNAELYFFGNNIYTNRVIDNSRFEFLYYYSLKKNKLLFKYAPLEFTNALQLINEQDKSIVNIGVDLKIRDDIFYKE